MKFQFLRRTGALVLALVLALTLTVPAWAADVTKIALNKTSLTLEVDGSEKLTATITRSDDSGGETQEEGTQETVTWDSSDKKVASVNANGKVTAKAVGTATITAKAGDQEAKCTVTVTAKPAPSLVLDGRDSITADPGTLTLTAILRNAPEGAEESIQWTVRFKSTQKETTLPKLNGTEAATATGETVTLDSSETGPGDFVVTATYGDLAPVTKNVTISGIVMTAAATDTKFTGTWQNHSREMLVNDSVPLTVDVFGDADDKNATLAEWVSSVPSTVSIPHNGGSAQAWQLGKNIIITATKGKYTDRCTINVVEDESVIAGPYTASVSKPLKFLDKDPAKDIGLFSKLNGICTDKTGTGLDYITNLEVVRVQGSLPGTLYYNYSSEADTGAGVGFADQFAEKASGAIKGADRLYFVPKTGFTGTAEIKFSGIAKGGNGNFTGVIKVNVGAGSGGSGGSGGTDTYQITYRAKAGEPVWFLADDFKAFCQSATGRNYHTITFNLPKSSEGVLYYNYAGGTGTPVSTTTKFTPSGVYTIDNVCFVPNATFTGEKVTISFTAVDTSGETVNDGAVVEVFVDKVDVSADPSSVTVFCEKDQPVTLQGELFNDACQNTIKDTLSFVTFKLPDPKEGVLYYNYKSGGNYESRVAAFTRYYYSGVPGLSGVTFVPGSGASGRIAIPYTGYGSTGTSFSGTLYISLDEANSSTIRYFVEKNGSVTFRASDFYNAGLYQKGVGVDYVTFTNVPNMLRYNYESESRPGSLVYSNTRYYVSPGSGQNGLNLISFHATGSTGTATVNYTACCGTGSSQQIFTGQVVIQVGAIAAADVNVFCNTGDQAGLSSYSLNSACSPVIGEDLSYIEITSVPSSQEGHLYLNYYGFGTGTVVKPGNRFYCAGSPGIGQLKFVPRAGFTGKAEITYIGYNDDGTKQASGRIMVNVSRSTSSWYFNDMGNHVWAIDSVDYLYRNGTVNGVGGGRYSPAGTITKGDFTLMLVRAYGLTAGGSASFEDVPADSYYADAIRIAALLGVASGSNGYYNPKTALSRQDAMLMIFNALKASGRSVTNGLAADLSIFYDEGDIAPYAKEAVGSLVQLGVVEGDGNGYLRPRSQLNRAETAKLLHAIMTL